MEIQGGFIPPEKKEKWGLHTALKLDKPGGKGVGATGIF